MEEPMFDTARNIAYVIFYIPYKGDANIFGYHYRTQPASPTYAVSIDGGILIFQVTPLIKRVAEAQKTLAEMQSQIAQYFPLIKQALELYNPQFMQVAKTALQARHQEVMQKQQAAIRDKGLPRVGYPRVLRCERHKL